MGFYRAHILPRLVDTLCSTGAIARLREDAAGGLAGEVVEVGFGSGLNLPAYPPEVTRVYAVEPEATALRLAERRIQASPIEVLHVGLDGARLLLDDASCDGALVTFALCTIPDVTAALGEIRRVLRPGGRFHFLEHGLSPEAEVARKQRRYEPIQRHIAGGCHLTRDPVQLVTDAGFTIERADARYLGIPKAMTWTTIGLARIPTPDRG